MTERKGSVPSALHVNKQVQGSENWLIEKSLKCLADGKVDQARAWILTAKSLYPKDFSVQYGLLQMQMSAGQMQDAAVLLSTLLDDFPDEQLLWEFVEQMMNAVETRRQNTSLEQDVLTFSSLFAEMNSHQQQKMISSFANHVRGDAIRYCRVLVLLMRLHPASVQSSAIPAIDAISEAMRSAQLEGLNKARHILVAELLPAILSSQHLFITKSPTSIAPPGHLCITQPTVQGWLEWTLEYYVDMAWAKATPSQAPVSLMSPTRTRRFSLDGHGVDVGEVDPWDSAWEQLARVASLCQWSTIVDSGLLDRSASLLERSQRLAGLSSSRGEDGKGKSGSRVPKNETPLLYVTMLVWLESCWHYCHPASVDSSLPSSLLLLPLSRIKDTKIVPVEPEAKRSRRSRTSEEVVAAHLSIHPDLPASCTAVADHFKAAVQSWRVLNTTDSLRKKSDGLLKVWAKGQWTWPDLFQRDFLLYEGNMDRFHKLSNAGDAPLASALGVAALQIAFAAFVQDRDDKACRQIVAIFRELPDDNGHIAAAVQRGSALYPDSQDASAPCREFQLTPSTCFSLVASVVQALICYYMSLGVGETTSDIVLGHLLVLCQCNWPQYEPQFSEVSDIVRERKAFSYPQFFDYVVNVDVLEEMSFLHNSGLKLTLLTCNGNPAKRTVTRGVNKGAMEETRSAIERQVMHINGDRRSVNARLVRFLKECKTLF